MNDTDESENILWNISGFRAPKSYDMTPLLLEPPKYDIDGLNHNLDGANHVKWSSTF